MKTSSLPRPPLVTLLTALLTTLFALLASAGPLGAQVLSGRPQTPPPSRFAIEWEELGPAPILPLEAAGRVSAIACSSTDPDRYFVGGADGGVWRSDDGGASWSSVTHALPTTSVGALAIDPSNGQVIYMGSGESNYLEQSRYGLGLFRSVDGGDHWEHLAEADFGGRCFSRIVVDPLDGAVVFAAITQAGGFPLSLRPAARNHPGRDGLLGLFRSADGGTSWTQLTGGLPNSSCTDLVMHPTSPQVLYAAFGHVRGASTNGVYRSVDGGTSWGLLPGGMPSGLSAGRINLDIAPSDPSRLYTLIANPCNVYGVGATNLGAWQSSDGGDSWSALPIGGLHPYHTGLHSGVVRVDPTNPDIVLFGGRMLLRSTTAGSGLVDVSAPHQDEYALAFDAAGRLLLGNSGGLYRSPDGSGSWTSLNRGLGTVQLFAGIASHPLDDEIIIAGSVGSAGIRRSSPPPAWNQILLYFGWARFDHDDPQRVFAGAMGSGNFYLSTDGGVNFTWSGSGIDPTDSAFLPPILVDPTDTNRLLYATNRIYLSTDGGIGWTPISAALSGPTHVIRTLAHCPTHPDVVWAVLTSGAVHISQDGGVSFTQVLTVNSCRLHPTREVFCHPEDASTAWVADARFGVTQLQVTRDHGQTWTPLDGNLPDVPVNTVAVIPGARDRIFVGTDRGLLFSPNGGGNWRRYGEGLPPAVIVDILIETERHRIVVATQGRGMWRAPLGLRVR
jgi:photosystem II stability/assembly factor-like uncharacterized protein